MLCGQYVEVATFLRDEDVGMEAHLAFVECASASSHMKAQEGEVAVHPELETFDAVGVLPKVPTFSRPTREQKVSKDSNGMGAMNAPVSPHHAFVVLIPRDKAVLTSSFTAKSEELSRDEPSRIGELWVLEQDVFGEHELLHGIPERLYRLASCKDDLGWPILES